ncbi:unnamed protein product, partial [Scytosiphon promiscuus]
FKLSTDLCSSNRYVQMVWMERNSQEMVFDNNVLPLVSPRVPTQTNGSDCGVYVLRYTKA